MKLTTKYLHDMQVSSDLSIVDLDVSFSFVWCASSAMNTYSILGVLTVLTWQVLFISVPLLILAIRLQVMNKISTSSYIYF
jgi:ATP-binding cassette, subfamily C (CFTR/MRP), member 2